MRSEYILGLGQNGFHRLHYTEWGDPNNDRVVICAHGLTGTGRAFDMLAMALRDRYRVVCPDMPGRGKSDWLEDKDDYNLQIYLADIAVLLARLNVEEVDWVGTSLGGLIGMLFASQTRAPIRRMVLNDIGPFIPNEAVDRIKEYVGNGPNFKAFEDLEQYIRMINAPFGALTDAQWRHLAEHSHRELGNGEYAMHYDPEIGQAFRQSAASSIELWHVWDAMSCPVRVLRGANSDMLLAETIAEMKNRGPGADVVEFSDVGHAPALMAEDQIAAVKEWLHA